MAGEPRDGSGGYVRPRIVLAFVLAALLVMLFVADVTRTDYAVSEVTLTVLIGTILTLVGIEVHEMLRGGRDD